MYKLKIANINELQIAMDIINGAKQYLKEQRIDQWQKDYPDKNCIKQDILSKKGFFITENENICGYLCIDYDGEPAYSGLKGEWHTEENYVVVHRMAFTKDTRGKGISFIALKLIEEMSVNKGVLSFRVDTDENNLKMRHILEKSGFKYCGIIWFDNSIKIAFDKSF